MDGFVREAKLEAQLFNQEVGLLQESKLGLLSPHKYTVSNF